jgi:hypothetical protein
MLGFLMYIAVMRTAPCLRRALVERAIDPEAKLLLYWRRNCHLKMDASALAGVLLASLGID